MSDSIADTAVHHESQQRRHAATLLRQAHRRLDAGLDASDSCGWAIAALPDSRAAQGLMIDALLSSQQCEEAHTLATTLLRQRPDDWRLWRRRAQALLALDRPDEAHVAIHRALEQRPNHRQTLLLAAEIAGRRGDRPSALAALERADARYPRDAQIARRLIAALIDNHRADDAEAVLEQMPDASPLLRASVYRAQGRMLDARLTLEDAAYYELDELRRERLLLALIDVLEETRDWPALRQWRANAEQLSPAIALRLAQSCLCEGAHDEGLELLAAAESDSTHSSHACGPVAAALHATAGDAPSAMRMLSTPRLADRDLSPAMRCRPWLQGLLGMMVAEQTNVRDVRRAGADPSRNVLDGLRANAMETFDAALLERNDADQAPMWRAMRRMCEATDQPVAHAKPQERLRRAA